MGRKQFNLSTALLLVALVGMGIGWWKTYHRAQMQIKEHESRLSNAQAQLQLNAEQEYIDNQVIHRLKVELRQLEEQRNAWRALNEPVQRGIADPFGSDAAVDD